MDLVRFPILNLELKINNVAINIAGISIYWYAIFIVSAIVIAMFILKKRDGLFGIKFEDIINLAIFVIPISIISARIYYILFYDLRYYLENPIEIIDIRTGGLAIYGGLLGGLITIIIFCKKNKIDILNLLDYIVPVIALRPGNRQMGKFYKCRSLWNRN